MPTPQQNDEAKQQARQEMTQIFNIGENAVMNYIANFLDDAPSVVFNTDIPDPSEPFILLPLEDYKKHICLKFNMVSLTKAGLPVNPADQSIIDGSVCIDDVCMFDKVREGVGFMFYCAKTVYSSIIHTSMIDNKPLTNTELDFNQANWSFQPKFYHDTSLKIKFNEKILGKIMYIRKKREDFPPETVANADNDYKQVIDTLVELGKKNTEVIKDDEDDINSDFYKRPRLQVFITELHEKDLPKPIMSASEDMSIQNAKLPKISESAFD